nr:MAG TPA: Photosynthesis system II assembly factor YCF48 [Caudoviricetes sp.]
MSIIQRRADSGVKSGKYVAAVDMRKQFFSTDYGLSFTEKKCNFTYITVAVAILEDTGNVFVANANDNNNIFVSKDNLATVSVFYPNYDWADILGIEITRNGDKLYALSDRYMSILDGQTGALISKTVMNASDVLQEFAVSANGKFIAVASKKTIIGSDQYGSSWNISIPIESSSSTKNQLYDMVMSGDGRCIFYSYVSGSEDYNGLFRLHSSDGFTTRERISVAGINDYYVPIRIYVSHTGQHILLCYSSQGNYISHDFGRSFTALSDMNNTSLFSMSSNGKYIYCINGAALYRSADYGNTFSLALSGINSSYKLAISK